MCRMTHTQKAAANLHTLPCTCTSRGAKLPTKRSTSQTQAPDSPRAKDSDDAVSTHDGAPRRILVADDDTDIRQLLKTFLEDERYEVSEAPDGEGALEG